MSRPDFSTASSDSSTSPSTTTSTSSSQPSLLDLQDYTRIISSAPKRSKSPRGLSAETTQLAKELHKSTAALKQEERAQFFAGGLQWLMESTAEAEEAYRNNPRRRGSLLTERAVKINAIVEGNGSRMTILKGGSGGSDTSSEESELRKSSSEATGRIDAWVHQQTRETSDPLQ